MNDLARKMRQLIARDGPITFARFMETALYEPGQGYYEKPDKVGRRGDYFTSVSVGPLFGRLLAFQFAQWLDTDCPNGGIQIIETGAHDGRLAADILEWLAQNRRDLFVRLQYQIIESSPVRRSWQQKTLRAWPSAINWVGNIGDFPERSVNGIIFSNEFFDSLPVHRLAWDAAALRWREWRVAVCDDAFAWRLGEIDPPLNDCLPVVPGELAKVLPDGFIVEVCPAAASWWGVAARALCQGRLLAIDYGFHGESALRPDRPNGTLRAFWHHHRTTDLLAQPGEQDLTADVDFFALEQAGLEAGLAPATLVGQSRFLTEIVSRMYSQPESPGAWASKESFAQFQTLTHPEHLGHRFQVFIQSRGA